MLPPSRYLTLTDWISLSGSVAVCSTNGHVLNKRYACLQVSFNLLRKETELKLLILGHLFNTQRINTDTFLILCSGPGSVGGLDCVHLLHPSLYGTDAVIAAGSRDSNVYLWRRRSGEGEGEGTRTMRSFTSQSLSGHKV